MIEAGEFALSRVLIGYDYSMPTDGIARVLRAMLSAAPKESPVPEGDDDGEKPFPPFEEMVNRARKAVRELADWTHVNEAEWSGWGDQIIPPTATFWRVKAEQAAKALDELPAAPKGGAL